MSNAAAGPTLAKTPDVPSLRLFDLAGQVALVTGGTRGIGASCAIALAEAGADVVLAQRPGSGQSATHDAIAALGRRTAIVTCDLADLSDGEASVKKCFDKAVEVAKGWGRDDIDILLNCGGIQRRYPTVDFPEAEWDSVLNTNLKAVFLLSQAAGRHMVPRRRGKIISFASLMTYQGGLNVVAYTAAKHAVAGMTKSLSNEWSRHNINVNAIAPGYIISDMTSSLAADPERSRQIGERIPAGRWGEPADFKGIIVFLASQASNYVSGETIVVDGGWMGR